LREIGRGGDSHGQPEKMPKNEMARVRNAAPQWRFVRSFGADVLSCFVHASNKSVVYCLGTPLAK
jgi:hypothetical protein